MVHLLPMHPLFEDLPAPTLPRDPSRVVVSISGGKDSIAGLLKALEIFGSDILVAHHQILLEDWLGTPEYCQSVCDYLGVPLYLTQGKYNGFLCPRDAQRDAHLAEVASQALQFSRCFLERDQKYLCLMGTREQ